MEIDLSDRVAIVTGAGRGIGEAIAVQFAEAGADVAVVARTASELEATVAAIERRGGEGLAVVADLTDDDDVVRVVDETEDAFGPPHVLVNNAGVFLASPPVEQSTEEIDLMLDLNLRAPILLTQQFCEAFRRGERDAGRIINVASNVARVVVPGWTTYSGTKAGVTGITRGFAIALADEGITVNSVSPGTTRTPAVETVIEEMGDEIYDFDRLPMERIAEPADIANACLFLASDLADYVTGEDIVVDGGVSITSGFYR